MFYLFQKACAFCLTVSWTISMASGQPWLMIEGIGTSNSSLHGNKRRHFEYLRPGTAWNPFFLMDLW